MYVDGTMGVDYSAGGLTYTVQVANDLAGAWLESAPSGAIARSPATRQGGAQNLSTIFTS